MLCWSWAKYFSAAASSENDHGSMNLDSKTASVPSTMPAGVEFIDGNGGGPGVRLRKRQGKKP